jgi:hypothetical protein
VIALATLLLGAVLFTLYLRAYRAHMRNDDLAAERWRALTTPFWAVAAVAKVAQGDALLAAICSAMTITGLWAWADYRAWRGGEQVKLFADDADSETPTEILKPGRDLTEAEAAEIKERWIEAHQDKRGQSRPEVLDSHYRGGAQPVTTMPEPTSPPPGPSGVSPSEDGSR